MIRLTYPATLPSCRSRETPGVRDPSQVPYAEIRHRALLPGFSRIAFNRIEPAAIRADLGYSARSLSGLT